MRFVVSGKGSTVLVEGRLQSDLKTGGPKTFTRQDGTMGTSFEIAANTVRFLSSREGGAAPAAAGATSAASGGPDEVPVGLEEEIPF